MFASFTSMPGNASDYVVYRYTQRPRGEAMSLNLNFAPAQVRELATRGRWLDQELIVLDPRMPDALEAALTADAIEAITGNGERHS